MFEDWGFVRWACHAEKRLLSQVLTQDSWLRRHLIYVERRNIQIALRCSEFMCHVWISFLFSFRWCIAKDIYHSIIRSSYKWRKLLHGNLIINFSILDKQVATGARMSLSDDMREDSSQRNKIHKTVSLGIYSRIHRRLVLNWIQSALADLVESFDINPKIKN